jgi:hypothetical protein
MSAEYDLRLLRNFSRPAAVAAAHPKLFVKTYSEVFTFGAEHRTPRRAPK